MARSRPDQEKLLWISNKTHSVLIFKVFDSPYWLWMIVLLSCSIIFFEDWLIWGGAKSLQSDMGLNLRILRSPPAPKPRVWCLTECATQAPHVVSILKVRLPERLQVMSAFGMNVSRILAILFRIILPIPTLLHPPHLVTSHLLSLWHTVFEMANFNSIHQVLMD